MAEDSTWQAVFLIPNGDVEYRGIGLVDVVCKVVKVILNRHFTASISVHDILHGFWLGSGTCTSSLRSKLLKQLMSTREDFLYAIFLYLHKAYDALDSYISLDILEGWRLGPQSCRILSAYWDRILLVVDCMGDYYGLAF